MHLIKKMFLKGVAGGGWETKTRRRDLVISSIEDSIKAKTSHFPSAEWVLQPRPTPPKGRDPSAWNRLKDQSFGRKNILHR